MAAAYMSKASFAPVITNDQRGAIYYPNDPVFNRAYEYAGAVIAAPGNGEAVLVPPEVEAVTLVFHSIAGGTGHLEVSCSPKSDVDAGTAIWFTPTGGATLSADTMIQIPPCTAFRIVNASNSTQLFARAQ